jgi:hypothetical protein
MYKLYYLYINLEDVKSNLGSLTGGSVVMHNREALLFPTLKTASPLQERVYL